MKAYLAGGCFWCITPIYKIYGVSEVTAGYSGGTEETPAYLDVKKQKTGHRETIELTYEPENVSYEELLEIFFENIDPFDAEGQFIDRGFSYTPAIYYQTEAEKRAALSKIAALEQKSGKKVTVSVEPFRSFFKAEEEHQDYYLKHPEAFEKEMTESGRREMNGGFVVKTFPELTSSEVYEILRSRAEVFVKEQGIRCIDPDGTDYESLHLFRLRDGRIQAYLRAYKTAEGFVKIGRVLTLVHGQGTGTELMRFAMKILPEKTGCRRIVMDAQKHAVPFYERLGFTVTSGEYLEEGIVHVDMAWDAPEKG